MFGEDGNRPSYGRASQDQILCWSQGPPGVVGAQAEVSPPAHLGLFSLPRHSQRTGRARLGGGSRRKPSGEKGMVMSERHAMSYSLQAGGMWCE